MVPTQDFLGLVAALRATQKKIRRGLLANLYEKVVRDTPEPLRDLLVSSTDDDIDPNVALDAPTKGKLKTSRNRLRRMVSAEHVECLRKVKLIDEVIACTGRVLNPSAHSGSSPLYKKEVEDALALIKQLEASLSQ